MNQGLQLGGRIMSNFNNHEYQTLVSNLIQDAFYVDTSLGGKASTIRRYAEVIVRKVLDIEPTKKITLGKPDIKKKISSLPNHQLVEAALQTIKDKGDPYSHTECLTDISPKEFDKVIDSLFDLLSFMLINYFEKYEFGSRNDVMTSFSLLPPIIRYKVLAFLNKKNPNNIMVIDKLVLAIMKSFNVDEALCWIEKEKNHLSQLKPVSEKAIKEISEKQGSKVAKMVLSSAPDNMYILCKDKISKVGAITSIQGTLYSDFESALPYYKSNGILKGGDTESKEFNDIMNFLYLGRKERLDKLAREKDPIYLWEMCI